MRKVGKAKENNLKPFCTFYTSFEFIVVLLDQLMKKSKKREGKKGSIPIKTDLKI